MTKTKFSDGFRAFLIRAKITEKEYKEFTELNKKEKLEKPEKEKLEKVLNKLIDTRRELLKVNKRCEEVEGVLA